MYPTYSLFTTDLHALGQYLQDGSRNFIETTLFVENSKNDIKLKIAAHSEDGKVNNLLITLSKGDEYHYGYLFIWLAHAAMMSAYLLKVNPFDQPGVESYKKNMFRLLGRK